MGIERREHCVGNCRRKVGYRTRIQGGLITNHWEEVGVPRHEGQGQPMMIKSE